MTMEQFKTLKPGDEVLYIGSGHTWDQQFTKGHVYKVKSRGRSTYLVWLDNGYCATWLVLELYRRKS